MSKMKSIVNTIEAKSVSKVKEMVSSIEKQSMSSSFSAVSPSCYRGSQVPGKVCQGDCKKEVKPCM